MGPVLGEDIADARRLRNRAACPATTRPGEFRVVEVPARRLRLIACRIPRDGDPSKQQCRRMETFDLNPPSYVCWHTVRQEGAIL